MTSNRLTPLTESGILAALSVVLGLMAVYLPIIGVVAVMVWALPLLILTVRHGLKYGLAAAVAAMAVLSLFAGPPLAFRLFLAFAPTGVVLGWAIRKEYSGTRTFFSGLAASIGGKLLGFALIFFLMGIDPWQAQIDGMKEAFDATSEMYTAMGVDAQELAQSQQQIDGAIAMVAQLAPLIVLIMGLFDTFVLYFLGSRVLKRLGHAMPQALPPFSEWRMPRAFLYLFVLSLLAMYWGASHEIPILQQAGLNANMIAMMAGLVQGLALLHVLLKSYNVRTFLRTFIYIFVCLNGLLLQVVAFAGLVDIYVDYRRRFAKSSGR
ncbi:YybS family protein [uncultured Selenomonas sp.]|uniref:YybS family protein n=1 Tax=uncultured Selenomonas sp. TaxID=159275 RepID=UPI0025DFA6E6|nr:YybS family protein [uncultured Selenomonas sp.]